MATPPDFPVLCPDTLTPSCTHSTSMPSSLPSLDCIKKSSVAFQKKIGQLARQSQCTDPHAPVWVPGLSYPVQYVVRQTRSMASNRIDDNNNSSNNNDNNNNDNDDFKLVVSIRLSQVVRTTCSVGASSSHSWSHAILPDVNKLRKLLKPLDFFLPDKTFLEQKLDKLKEIDKLKNSTSLTDASGSASIVRATFSGLNHNFGIFNEKVIKMPSGTLTVHDVYSNEAVTSHHICSVYQYTNISQIQSVNSHQLFWSKPLRSIQGTVIWTPPHTFTSTLKIYRNDVVLTSVGLSSDNEVKEVELFYVNIEHDEVLACVTDLKQCWVYVVDTSHSAVELVVHEQLVNYIEECGDVSSVQLSHSHWLLHKVGVAGRQEHCENYVIISLHVSKKDGGGSIVTFHMEKISCKWSLLSSSVPPQSTDVDSCCTCEGLPRLLLGLSNQQCKLLIWDIVSSCVLCCSSISCQPLPSSFPMAILIHAGKKHGKNKDTVINIVICLLTTPTTNVSSSLPIGWLVSCDTISGRCQRILSYKDTPTLSDTDHTPAYIVDHCHHGDYYSLLFSDDRVSCWNVNQSNPINTQLIKGNATTCCIKGVC